MFSLQGFTIMTKFRMTFIIILVKIVTTNRKLSSHNKVFLYISLTPPPPIKMVSPVIYEDP